MEWSIEFLIVIEPFRVVTEWSIEFLIVINIADIICKM